MSFICALISELQLYLLRAVESSPNTCNSHFDSHSPTLYPANLALGLLEYMATLSKSVPCSCSNHVTQWFVITSHPHKKMTNWLTGLRYPTLICWTEPIRVMSRKKYVNVYTILHFYVILFYIIHVFKCIKITLLHKKSPVVLKSGLIFSTCPMHYFYCIAFYIYHIIIGIVWENKKRKSFIYLNGYQN